MPSTDPKLGLRIRLHLEERGIETPLAYPQRPAKEFQEHDIRLAFADIMRSLGLDLGDDSLSGTPARIAKMYAREIFEGLDYDNFPKCTTVENKMGYDEVVCVREIDVKSVCEHHFVPFIGTADVAYIPKHKVMGLSKFNRIVNFFARRPQIQERMTEQIHATLCEVLETDDVAIVMRAKHFCVHLRGVQDPQSSTVTSKLSGRFRTVDPLRAEFLAVSR